VTNLWPKDLQESHPSRVANFLHCHKCFSFGILRWIY